jgi:hypothetical protein
LTYAQAAALEAFEEAGVHGRMEDDSFTHYFRRKRADMRGPAGSGDKIVVNAHLCEVLRLGPPQESNRNPTWFSVLKAKNRLREDRKADNGAQLAHVIDLAVARIQRLCSATRTTGGRQKDALQKVQFEALGAGRSGRIATASFVQYIRGQRRDIRPSAAIKLAVKANLGQVLQLAPAREVNQFPATFPAESAKPRLESTFNSRKRPLDPTGE